ncbi:hypothetical protein DUI87_02132 [Hirundo rustica rustica]|uniref:ribonuclease H n=1 Tax=Hirundo rustica rustica TaxID=333673 RepID=A0A3M0L854_HIRRU|nr:hypothetical protein DUI87_02132 [Hirundo rustica rustica]
MTVLVSHTMSAVLEAKGGHWLSPQRFLKYQAILVEQDDVEIVVTNIVNPASFLSRSIGEPVIHDCLETIEATYSSHPDLKDTPLEDAETWFTDGSSYVISGRRHAGYAVTTSREVIESGPLPTNTSAQKAEIIALIRALELAKGKEINIYTDSKYAFGVVHAHGAIWKERGLLNSQGKSIKHAQEILRLLDAIQLPEKVAIMHIKAHKKKKKKRALNWKKGICWWTERQKMQQKLFPVLSSPPDSLIIELYRTARIYPDLLTKEGDKYHLEPVITLKVVLQEEELEFVVDTGAERTCLLNVPKGYSVSKDTAKVTGAKGETFTVPVIKDVVIEGETKIWVGDVLLVPKAGSNLLGRDLQVKLGIGVIPEDGKMTAKVLKFGQEDEEKINKEVWAGEGNRGGLNIDPISVTIEREDCPIRVRQYPISLEGREGLKPVIEGLIKDGTLEPCMSPHNTPILPVKKPDGSYRLVQDLREVDKRTRSRYPVVPNPYTLLSKVPPQHQWFSVVDLKDAFWACPLAKESRDIFAFEWEDPKTGRKQQLRRPKLPQGFTESPNLFGQALEKILQASSTPPRIQIIQYVDDLLLSGEDEVEVREATIKLLNFLGEKGLRVSKGKLQFVEPEFVDRLRSQVERQVQDPEVQAELIKEMAQRNGNGTCRRIILSLPLDPSPSLTQMIEACTKKAELFSASERNPGLTHPKPVAAAAPGARRQPMSSDQLQHIICHPLQKARTLHQGLPRKPETSTD